MPEQKFSSRKTAVPNTLRGRDLTMALYVNTNVSALTGQKNLADVTSRLNTSFERLSSGSRINSAKDDAAGLQVANRLNIQVQGLTQASRNANDGISIAQIAEGALGEVTNNVQRMRQLVIQNGNGVLDADDRKALKQEFSKLMEVNSSIAERTAFGTKKLLDGSAPSDGLTIQSGAFSEERDSISTGNATLAGLMQGVAEDDTSITASTALVCDFSTSTVSNYGILGKLAMAYFALNSDLATISEAMNCIVQYTAGASITLDELTSTAVTINVDAIQDLLTLERAAGATSDTTIASMFGAELLGILSGTSDGTAVSTSSGFTDNQLQALRDYATDALLDFMSDLGGRVDTMRATLGAQQNGLLSTIRSNSAAVVNVSDSKSRIMDTDFAAETAELTRNQIIQQASNTILAQANQLPQTALSLLG